MKHTTTLTLLLLATTLPAQVRNVILMIPDGTTLAVFTLARWVKAAPLATDRIVTGLVRTHWAGGPITDSAPAATAMATGYKTWDQYIAVSPPRTAIPDTPEADIGPEAPLATILEAARLRGMATGLVATCEIPHATPAAFSSHALSRQDYDDIAEQQVHQNLDLVLAGGHRFLRHHHRKDNEDLLAELRRRGTTVVTNLEDLRNAPDTPPLWGLLAPTALPMDYDRDPSVHPSLAEMTRKALAVLSQNTNGFLLIVEGSQVDWAAHANDPAGILSEFLAFDAAVETALAFAERDGRTAVIVAPDHGNSGLSIGSRDIADYASEPLDRFVIPLRNARTTSGRLARLIASNRPSARQLLRQHWGWTNLSADEETAIRQSSDQDLPKTLAGLLSRRAGLGFTTGGHTGEDVLLGFYAPPGHPRLEGLVDNTDIALHIDRTLNLGLARLRKALYPEASRAFPEAALSEDRSNPHNPVLVVRLQDGELRFPLNKDYAFHNGRQRRLLAPTVRIRDRWFLPPLLD